MWIFKLSVIRLNSTQLFSCHPAFLLDLPSFISALLILFLAVEHAKELWGYQNEGFGHGDIWDPQQNENHMTRWLFISLLNKSPKLWSFRITIDIRHETLCVYRVMYVSYCLSTEMIYLQTTAPVYKWPD